MTFAEIIHIHCTADEWCLLESILVRFSLLARRQGNYFGFSAAIRYTAVI